MIKKAEYLEKLSTFDKNIFGCRIIATAEAYGMNEPFAQFWVQEDNAAILKLDDTVIINVVKPEEADFSEIHDFIPLTGVSKVLCDLKTAQKLGLNIAVRGKIMEYHNDTPIESNPVFKINPSLRDVYSLLIECETDNFTPPEFEPFYMDMSHRIRHSTAVSVGMYQGEKLVSGALCSAFTNNCAILSATAVCPEHRRKGLGHNTILELISQLKQEKIYILRAENENKEFYESLRFTDCGEFAEMTI